MLSKGLECDLLAFDCLTRAPLKLEYLGPLEERHREMCSIAVRGEISVSMHAALFADFPASDCRNDCIQRDLCRILVHDDSLRLVGFDVPVESVA